MSTHIRIGDRRFELRSKESVGDAIDLLGAMTRDNVRSLTGGDLLGAVGVGRRPPWWTLRRRLSSAWWRLRMSVVGHRMPDGRRVRSGTRVTWRDPGGLSFGPVRGTVVGGHADLVQVVFERSPEVDRVRAELREALRCPCGALLDEPHGSSCWRRQLDLGFWFVEDREPTPQAYPFGEGAGPALMTLDGVVESYQAGRLRLGWVEE